MDPSSQLLTSREIDTRIHRLAYEILEHHPKRSFSLIGIHRRGVPLAQRLAKVLEEERPGVQTGMLDITLYRDDPGRATFSPDFGRTKLPNDLKGSIVILVDDVLYTGRTIRAAIDALFEYGRPAKIELAVLVDRGGRELPIQPDYCGIKQPLGTASYLQVRLREVDGLDGLFLVQNKHQAS